MVIKDRAISACRDLGMPLTESDKQTAKTACCRLFQLAHKRPITKQGLVGTVPENGLPWRSKNILPKSPSKFKPLGVKNIGKGKDILVTFTQPKALQSELIHLKMALMKIGFPLSTVARNFNKVKANVLAANMCFSCH